MERLWSDEHAPPIMYPTAKQLQFQHDLERRVTPRMTKTDITTTATSRPRRTDPKSSRPPATSLVMNRATRTPSGGRRRVGMGFMRRSGIPVSGLKSISR